jgi:hypothetical protein
MCTGTDMGNFNASATPIYLQEQLFISFVNGPVHLMQGGEGEASVSTHHHAPLKLCNTDGELADMTIGPFIQGMLFSCGSLGAYRGKDFLFINLGTLHGLHFLRGYSTNSLSDVTVSVSPTLLPAIPAGTTPPQQRSCKKEKEVLEKRS